MVRGWEVEGMTTEMGGGKADNVGHGDSNSNLEREALTVRKRRICDSVRPINLTFPS